MGVEPNSWAFAQSEPIYVAIKSFYLKLFIIAQLKTIQIIHCQRIGRNTPA